MEPVPIGTAIRCATPRDRVPLAPRGVHASHRSLRAPHATLKLTSKATTPSANAIVPVQEDSLQESYRVEDVTGGSRVLLPRLRPASSAPSKRITILERPELRSERVQLYAACDCEDGMSKAFFVGEL